ncbi:MAG: D-alanine-D-alanine ligase [Alphaproteobacteria bacterium]|jgi:D-alanine-D-alanine ligase
MTQKKFHKIAVLSGGISQERDVSLVSAKQSCDALIKENYNAYLLDTAEPNWIQSLINQRPDAVLNMLHGRFGEDGVVQGVLESLKIPYTHSGVTASAIAMDKVHTKTILESHGLPVPKGFTAKPCDIYDIMRQKQIENTLSLPVVVKPVNEGSSVGVIIAYTLDDLKLSNFPPEMQTYDILMIEQFIAGREFTVSVFQGNPMTVTEILMPDRFYDYEAKYTQGGSKHIVPAQLPPQDFTLMMDYATKAHKVLNCKGVTRTDFRYGLGDSPAIFILEINTQPGMTPTSLVPEQAQFLNIDYQTLVAMMVEDASCNR